MMIQNNVIEAADRFQEKRPTESWKNEICLCDLHPDQGIEISFADRPTIFTTPRELVRAGRMPAFLSLAEVEFAFSTND